jgi:hypothetical protein
MTKVLLSRKRLLPWDVAERVADIAKVPKEKRSEFCAFLGDFVQLFWEQDEHIHPVKKEAGRILDKAARAARTLNEAVCSLEQRDRQELDSLVARDPRLSQETQWRSPTKLFETDELQNTVYLLDRLFSIAIGKSPPFVAGGPKLSKRRGTKKGDVKTAALHQFVHGLLSCVDEFGGTLELDKNRNFHEGGGPLADALTLLRPYVPERVVPDGKLGLSTLQRIKAEHKRREAELAPIENDRELARAAMLRAINRN